MLFNSYEFVLVFLPLALAGFYAFSLFGWIRAAAAWLGLASVLFYSYWTPEFVLLLLGSITFNYLASRRISDQISKGHSAPAKLSMGIAVAANLALLAYYKYANFFIDSTNGLTGIGLPDLDIILPIGISFFTFTQIAFLVDCWEGKVKESNPVHYLLFVTYFPHLIAGPVLHHAEMMPQFGCRSTYRWIPRNVAIGLAFFVMGLFKKVVLADGIQPYVGPVFDGGPSPDFFTAWGAALAYTLQLYFDFSGYSDMAIGLSKMFNVDLPLNFNSPYKAANISDFWRRWHMTLSRFLRDYLYIRLGGNRKGGARRYLNLMATMLLGGLWHGAGWTFVVWGGLHGLYLVINHAWQALRARMPAAWNLLPGPMEKLLSTLLTFLVVVIAWVFFRATNFADATRVLSGMLGFNGSGLAAAGWHAAVTDMSPDAIRQLVWTMVLLTLIWGFPNSQQLLAKLSAPRTAPIGAVDRNPFLIWTWLGAGTVCVLFALMINGSRAVSEFIYFNF
jgi:alginate O-acetyltransferase complex protein AlgI